MEFLYKKVHSEKYGDGTIANVDDGVFTIKFANEEKSFNYMIAFKNKALSFIEENDQNELNAFLDRIEQEKAEAERKALEIERQRKVEEAQKQEVKNRLMLSVEEALSNESSGLIGDYEFGNEDVEALLKNFSDAYVNNEELVSKLVESDAKSFLIVMINKLRDYDKPWNEFSELLSFFFDGLSLFDSQSKIATLYNKIDKLFADYGRVLFKTKSGKRAFEQTFLYEALAPKDSIESFVKLAWNLYLDEDILDSSYTHQDLELCLKVVNALNFKFSRTAEEDDLIQFSGSSYGIKAGLRYGCEQNKVKTAELLNKIFDYIHRVDHYSEEITENYLGTIVTDAVNKAKRVIVKKPSAGEKQHTVGYVHSFSDAKPTLYLDLEQHENPRVLLCFPKVMILNSDLDLEYAVVEIYRFLDKVGTKEKIYSSPFQYIKKNDACQTLRSFSIDITEKLIESDESFCFEVILKVRSNHSFDEYSSGTSLFRDYIVFKDQHEVRNTSRPGTFCLVVPKQFNPADNLKLFDEKPRKVSNGIFYFTSKELDFIDYKGTKLLFGSSGRPANVLFKDEDIHESNQIWFIPDQDNVDREIPVYTSLSDIYIENDNSTSPSSIRLSHSTNDIEDGSISKGERFLSELQLVDRRYFYSKEDNGLILPGWHSLEIIKLTAVGAKSMLNSPKFEYFYDEGAKVKCKELAYIKSNVELIAYICGKKYSVPVGYLDTSVLIETDAGLFKVVPPYFRWKFGAEADYKYKPSETPIFIDDIPSSSILSIDTNIKVEDIVFKLDDGDNYLLVDKSSSLENTFLISQFLSTNRKKGQFFAKTNSYGILPLFKVVENPYFKEDSLELGYDDGVLTYDFSKAFIHDKKDYFIKILIGVDELEEPIVLDELSPDDVGTAELSNFEDGTYTIEIYYYTNYSGIKGKEIKINLRDDCFTFGDDVKASFNSKEEILLQKCRISKTVTKKFKDTLIFDYKFLYDDGENRVYQGLLKSPATKHANVIFFASSPKTIRKIYFVYENNPSIKKEAHFNVQKNGITSDELVDGKVLFMSSIYID